MDNRKKVIFSFVFAVVLLITTIVLLFVLEMLAGYFEHSNLVPHFRLNHTWRPNGQCSHDEWISSNPEFNKPYKHFYNKQGWLEKYDIQEIKPEGTYRVFYVGDSFTEGTVTMEQSVPSLVEAALNKDFAGCRLKFEVINTGTSSYSPIIYYILIRYYILHYSPDLIVVNVYMTDDFDDWLYRQSLVVDIDGNPLACPKLDCLKLLDISGANLSGWDRIRLFFFDKSSLFRMLYKKTVSFFRGVNSNISENRDTKGYQLNSWVKYERDPDTQANVSFTLDILERIARYCKESNVKLLLTGVPHYGQFVVNDEGKRSWSIRPHQEIESIAKKYDVAYLDPFIYMDPYVIGTQQTDYYYKSDEHFNPRGYALWAQAHIKALVDPKNKLLPDCAYVVNNK